MDRKKAVVAAATIAGSLLAASTAYALTSGVVGGGPDDGAGDLSPVVEVPAASGGGATADPATAPSLGEDDHPADQQVTVEPDDHDHDDHDGDGDEHESDEPFHYEGRDDDD